jgi:hypothetical protein
MLTDAIGATCPEPTAVAVTSWATDPYSLGAYSHLPPGAAPADADLLGEPQHGRLLFAGEHTQSARLVYTDGAMASGIREAKRLLQRAHVNLGRGPADGSGPGGPEPRRGQFARFEGSVGEDATTAGVQ